ncbi:hypothetical protein NEMBOFW57_000523 [Staphylotrichum longicolle]|uniref:Uncharacterized protein n=1 Tax=Staphylotrichum longicolle TaxID=669026 RepID=A0AAD4I1R5_9PEZI|nr:hypothetical protein NEMBOFW57_000523 [Staphylotrichum longicolle]
MPPIKVYTQSPINAAKASGRRRWSERLPAGSHPGPDPGPAPRRRAYPPQMGIPPPQTGLNQRGTSTTLSPSAAPSAWDGSSQAGGSGGGGYPGYQQNVSAAGGYAAPSPYESGGGGGGGGGFGRDGDGGEEEGVWGSAVKFAKAAGKRLSEAESEVWKRINGEGSR